MASDFTGFNFLQAAMYPVSNIRRGYGLGDTAAPDIKRGYGLSGTASPDIRRGYGLSDTASPDIKRGYGLGSTASPDIRRGYGLGGAATPDMSSHAPGVTIGSATTVDTTQQSTSTYLALPQS